MVAASNIVDKSTHSVVVRVVKMAWALPLGLPEPGAVVAGVGALGEVVWLSFVTKLPPDALGILGILGTDFGDTRLIDN